MIDDQWYWCLRHNAIEPYAGCKAEDRLGPYATRDEAGLALEIVRLRNERWDRDDEQFGDDPDAPSVAGG
ncbi:hypothetical protein [Micropruina sp.]|uniref:hypothetical protein n=1 Tax=Micropruina sp. TaxID=2737536 RepID=UPI0039E4699B